MTTAMEDTLKALKIINQMMQDGVVGKYAIGGAIGALFYLEAISTEDIDVFISFKATPSGIITLGPIYEYLDKLGYKPEKEYIAIEGWLVQFLPADDALSNEALEQARETEVTGVKTRVMTAEHLIAIALKTGRLKDFARIEQFMQYNNPVALQTISANISAPRSTIKNTAPEVTVIGSVKVFSDSRLLDILTRHNLIEKWEKFKSLLNHD